MATVSGTLAIHRQFKEPNLSPSEGEARRAEINGAVTNLVSATYHLPVTLAGVQIDCPWTPLIKMDAGVC